MSRIIITGASGLIGTRLTEMLLASEHEVVHISRTKKSTGVPTFLWDVKKSFIENEAFNNASAVVHLAGTSVADKRWTPKQKLDILESRTQSTALLAQYLSKNPQVKTLVAASAIGYYGVGLTDHEFTEASNPGSDYLAKVVQAWEAEADAIKNCRVVKLRIGIVLSERGGALQKMVQPVNWFVGAPLGSGKQYISWIHLDDLCRMFIKALEDNSMSGVYNASGPNAVTNSDLTKTIAKVLHKPLLLPPVPGFVLRILLGEMADQVVNGSVVSSGKIQKAGFTFQFKTLEAALEDLLKK